MTSSAYDFNSQQSAGEEKKEESTTIVAFFGGTGYDFPHDAQGYVSQKELEQVKKKGVISDEHKIDIKQELVCDLTLKRRFLPAADGVEWLFEDEWRNAQQTNTPVLIETPNGFCVFGRKNGAWNFRYLNNLSEADKIFLNKLLDNSDVIKNKDFDLRLRKILIQGHEAFNSDSSMMDLNSCLTGNQTRFGYDGCHQRGGGVNATGTDEPVDHLYQKIKEDLDNNPGKKIKLVLTAHSRGCLSALKLAKKLAKSSYKDRVDVILDLRDPVPGNLKYTPRLDPAEITTTRQLYDLRECTNIKKVHLTVQERGILPVAFNVLVPKFSLETEVDMDALPGLHDIQERSPLHTAERSIYYNDTRDCYYNHYVIYLLGLCKSLKMCSDNGVELDRRRCLEAILEVYGYHLSCNNGDQADTNMLGIIKNGGIDSIHQLVENNNIDKAEFDKALDQLQLALYDYILQDYKNHPEREIRARDLHYGGEYRQVSLVTDATHLNLSHALLAEEVVEQKAAGAQPEPASASPAGIKLAEAQALVAQPEKPIKLLLGYEGRRRDLLNTEGLPLMLMRLVEECSKYTSYLAKKLQVNKEQLENILKNINDNDPDISLKKLRELHKVANNDNHALAKKLGVHYNDLIFDICYCLPAIKDLNKCFSDTPISNSCKKNVELLQKFEKNFQGNANRFSKSRDSRARQFFNTVGNILATFFTASIYAWARAAYSYKKHGYAKFWKTQEQVFAARTAEQLGPVEDRPRLKKAKH